MNFKRHALKNLESWKASKNRKPLILRGARQVGKTTLAKEFAKSYKHHIFLNLEKSGDAAIFQTYDNVETFVEWKGRT